jgi:hypothetical protein
LENWRRTWGQELVRREKGLEWPRGERLERAAKEFIEGPVSGCCGVQQ